ncbi:MAG: FAD:protein FMN transferase [Gemmatimonadota bacterium]
MVETTDPPCNAAVVERTAWLMGTTLTARVCAATRADGVEAVDRAFTRVRRLEARLSTWRSDSELSRLNNAPPGQWVPVSSVTAALLEEVREWTTATDRAFDPAVGAAIDAWGLRGTGRRPAPTELAAARAATGPDAWKIAAGTGRGGDDARVRRAAGVRLDAGAFGKGAALRSAAATLRSASLSWALLDFGGQLTLWSRESADRWSIGVADPERRDRTVLRLRIGSASIATTGVSERGARVDGARVGHVVDPRTAAPVRAWGSVTVVADDPLAADVLSTAYFVLGPDAALARAAEEGESAPGVLVLESAAAGLAMRRNERLDELASVGSITGEIELRDRGVFSNET